MSQVFPHSIQMTPTCFRVACTVPMRTLWIILSVLGFLYPMIKVIKS